MVKTRCGSSNRTSEWGRKMTEVTEREVVVGARLAGLNISETVGRLGFSFLGFT